MYNAQKIAQLIADTIIGKRLTKEEAHTLTSWLDASPENQQLFEKIKNGEASFQMLKLEQKNYGDKMASVFAKRKTEHAKRRLYKWTGSVAAAVALLVVVFTFSRLGNDTTPDIKLLSKNGIVPGKVHAVLTLADGHSVDITGSEKDSTGKDTSQDVYDALNATTAKELGALKEKSLEYYTLSVPAGGEFFFILPDSSKVWLNSKTELRFPLAFFRYLNAGYI